MHLLSWDTLTKHKSQGGLGMQKTSVKNRAMLSGLAWRLTHGPNALWGSLLKNKYKNHPLSISRIKCVSKTWKNIQDAWKNISDATRWVVHNGSQVNFFGDNWIPHFHRLRETVQGPLTTHESNLTVANLRLSDSWDFSTLY